MYCQIFLKIENFKKNADEFFKSLKITKYYCQI